MQMTSVGNHYFIDNLHRLIYCSSIVHWGQMHIMFGGIELIVCDWTTCPSIANASHRAIVISEISKCARNVYA
jgi:hypothetical protein